jgi:hypothetical protein
MDRRPVLVAGGGIAELSVALTMHHWAPDYRAMLCRCGFLVIFEYEELIP